MNFPYPSPGYVVFAALAFMFVGLMTLYIRRRERRAEEEAARKNWWNARSERKSWFGTHPSTSNRDPEGQRLFRIEVGAYMLYLASKRKVTIFDEKRLEMVLEAIKPEIGCVEPPKR